MGNFRITKKILAFCFFCFLPLSPQAAETTTIKHKSVSVFTSKDLAEKSQPISKFSDKKGPPYHGSFGPDGGTFKLSADHQLGDCVMQKGAVLYLGKNGAGYFEGTYYTKFTHHGDKWHFHLIIYGDNNNRALSEWPVGHDIELSPTMDTPHKVYSFHQDITYDASLYSQFRTFTIENGC